MLQPMLLYHQIMNCVRLQVYVYFYHTLDTVSYTHLDVYKRQMRACECHHYQLFIKL